LLSKLVFFLYNLQETIATDLEEKSALVATLKSTLEETSKQATDAAAKVAELEVRTRASCVRYLTFPSLINALMSRFI
jgi:hypothetical protein